MHCVLLVSKSHPFSSLFEPHAKQEINVRIERARDGNFGKRKRIQDGEGVIDYEKLCDTFSHDAKGG
jgi:putative component of toxin-antitoxin plasmid stabilization module